MVHEVSPNSHLSPSLNLQPEIVNYVEEEGTNTHLITIEGDHVTPKVHPSPSLSFPIISRRILLSMLKLQDPTSPLMSLKACHHLALAHAIS